MHFIVWQKSQVVLWQMPQRSLQGMSETLLQAQDGLGLVL
jgi:hypothetical protein